VLSFEASNVLRGCCACCCNDFFEEGSEGGDGVQVVAQPLIEGCPPDGLSPSNYYRVPGKHDFLESPRSIKPFIGEEGGKISIESRDSDESIQALSLSTTLNGAFC
jgi:hypothetical protein